MRGLWVAGAAFLLGSSAVWAAQGDGLQPVAAFAHIRDPHLRSLALFQEMARVIQSPRCLNCHPADDRPTQTDAMLPHSPPITRGDGGMGPVGLPCTTCHGAANVAFARGQGGVPGNPRWQLAPIEMAWQKRTPGQICRQLLDKARNGGRTQAQIAEHMGHDELVGWGWNPGGGRTPAPGTQAQFGALAQAWVETGAACPP